MNPDQMTPPVLPGLPDGAVVDADTRIVGYGRKYGELSINGKPAKVGSEKDFLGPDAHLPKSVFVDTSFLINLIGLSMSRPDVADRARERWSEGFRRGDVTFYWSPSVWQEFYHGCATYLFRFWQQERKRAPERHSPLWDRVDLELSADLRAEVARRSHPSPAFIAAVVPIIHELSLIHNFQSLVDVPDTGTSDDFLRLIESGN